MQTRHSDGIRGATGAGRAAVYLVLALAALQPVLGLDWDGAASTGYQHANGQWLDANWSANGTTLGPWIDGSNAGFQAVAPGSSWVTLDGASVTSQVFDVKGDNYRIVVTNGGQIVNSDNFIFGFGSTTPVSNTFVVAGGPGVTSRLDQTGSFWVGYAGNDNRFEVDGFNAPGSARVSLSGGMAIGYSHATSKSNLVVVKRGGLITVGGNLELGRSSPFHMLRVEQGGVLDAGVVYVGNGNNGGNSNALVITGANTLLDKVGILYAGQGRIGNRVILDDGACVTNVSSFRLGYSGSRQTDLVIDRGARLYTTGNASLGGNTAEASRGRVTGEGSVWDAGRKTLILGEGRDNELVVEAGGSVTNVGELRIGYAATAVGNRLIVTTGGRVGSHAASVIGSTAGAASNTVHLTGAGVRWDLHGGNLTIGNATGPGNALIVDQGACAADIGAMVVHPGQSLRLLSGTVAAKSAELKANSEMVVGVSSPVPPGRSTGLLEVATGTLVLGGSLAPVLRDAYMPPASDRLTVVTAPAGAISGAFQNLNERGQVVAVREDSGEPVGWFTVETEEDQIVLTRFRPMGGFGTVVLVR